MKYRILLKEHKHICNVINNYESEHSDKHNPMKKQNVACIPQSAYVLAVVTALPPQEVTTILTFLIVTSLLFFIM